MDRDDAERWDGERWGASKPLWTGEALTTLHPDTPGADRWVRDPARGWFPDCCDAHRPKEITEARKAEEAKREAAERALARMHHKPYVPPVDDEPEPRPVAEPEAPPEPPRRFGFLLRRRP